MSEKPPQSQIHGGPGLDSPGGYARFLVLSVLPEGQGASRTPAVTPLEAPGHFGRALHFGEPAAESRGTGAYKRTGCTRPRRRTAGGGRWSHSGAGDAATENRTPISALKG